MKFEIIREVGKHSNEYINLLTVNELHTLQSLHPNQVLISIFGDAKKAKSCNDDDRGGFVAFGVPFTDEP